MLKISLRVASGPPSARLEGGPREAADHPHGATGREASKH